MLHLRHHCQLGSDIFISRTKSFSIIVVVLFFCTYRWSAKSGQISTVCGTVDSGSALVFNSAGLRELTTPDIDTTVAAEVQFYLMIGK